MRLSDFDYNLPKELIAQYPQQKRDASRLLVVDRKNRTIFHRKFSHIVEYFRPGDLLLLNNTKVLPARIFGIREKTGARIEFLLLRRQNNIFSVMIKPAKRFQQNETILFKDDNGGIRARIAEKDKIVFDAEGAAKAYKIGTMPLPPYIKRKTDRLDFERYQTVFAKNPGSIAAPTAGLHFTQELLKNIKARGIDTSYITLHIGVGTFKPVKTLDITKHRMEPEYFEIEDKTIAKIKKTKENKQHIFVVGTTSCRTLEIIARQNFIASHLLPCSYSSGGERRVGKPIYSGWTDLFIFPGYKFKMTDCLLTNFHLPKSTLFMLVCAFAGRKLIMQAYTEAIKQRYRFYSYGDAMLII